MKHVWQLRQSSSCLRHPIMRLTTAGQMWRGDTEGLFATFTFLTFSEAHLGNLNTLQVN